MCTIKALVMKNGDLFFLKAFIFYTLLCYNHFAQESRSIFLNRAVNTPINSERMILLEKIILESGEVFPVTTKPITNNEWYTYVSKIVHTKKYLLNPNTLSRIDDYLRAFNFPDNWHFELYGRAEVEYLNSGNDERYFASRYEERTPFSQVSFEASRDTLFGFMIGMVSRNYWTTYLYTDNKTNLPLTFWEDYDFRIFHNAYFSYQSPLSKITVQAGRDKLKWGVGKRASLLLSDNVPYFDFVKFVLWFTDLKYSILYSTLTDYEPQYTNNGSYYDVSGLDKPPKSMLVQRIEYDFWYKLNIGLSYMKIIYGRYPVLGDLNPLIFQHNLFKEYQNSLASIDVTFAPYPGIQLYGEITSDEVNFSNDSKVDNANSPTAVSYQAGLNLYYSGFYFTGEYVFIAPFMYNHIHFLGRAIEIDGTRYYRSRTRDLRYMPLGHWLPPDSRSIYFSLEKSLSPFLNVSISFDHRNNGEINLLSLFPDKDYKRVDSPSGIVEKTDILGLSAIYNSPNYLFRSSLKYYSISNYLNTEGNSLKGWEIRFSAGVKFEIL